jgi:hypothetical protein
MSTSPPRIQASGSKIKDLFKKYGKVAIGVHLVVYTSFLTGQFWKIIGANGVSAFLFCPES